MTLKTIEELYTGPKLCPCGAVATVRNLCPTCWQMIARATTADAIAEVLDPHEIKETIMYGYSIQKDDTKPRRYTLRQALRDLRAFLGWTAVCLVGLVAIYVFVGGLRGFVIGAAESARMLAGVGK